MEDYREVLAFAGAGIPRPEKWIQEMRQAADAASLQALLKW